MPQKKMHACGVAFVEEEQLQASHQDMERAACC